MIVHDAGSGPELFAGGDFHLFELDTRGLVRWNGTTWSDAANGSWDFIDALAVLNDDGRETLCAAGAFNPPASDTKLAVARFDGSQWQPLGGFLDNEVHALAAVQHQGKQRLVAGGYWHFAGDDYAGHLAYWDDERWMPLSEGVGLGTGEATDVRTLTPIIQQGRESLFVGGRFAQAGDVATASAAILSTDGWDGLNGGIGRRDTTYLGVMALAEFEDENGPALYAGGFYSTADNEVAANLARWDGQSWTSLDVGVEGIVRSLCSASIDGESSLYAGGLLSLAGQTIVNNIARWNGREWHALAAGVDGEVNAIAVYDSGAGRQLIVAGDFLKAGGAPATRIASWDGRQWSPLGPGFNKPVLALAQFDSPQGPRLAAAGEFTVSGISQHKKIAQWNGQTWLPMGSGFLGTVMDLAVFDAGRGDTLCAGGALAATGAGASLKHLAAWTGVDWIPVPRPDNIPVNCMTVVDEGDHKALYLAGMKQPGPWLQGFAVQRWDGKTWQSVTTPSDGDALALQVFATGDTMSVVIGGDFMKVGQLDAAGIIALPLGVD